MSFHQWWSSIYQEVDLHLPLFYNMPVGLRFEIGPAEWDTNHPNYFKIAKQRAKIIWDDLFKLEDEVYVILQKFDNYNNIYRRHRFLERYFHKRPNQLFYEVLSNPYDEEDDETTLHRFAAKTTIANVRKVAWIQKCIYKDFGGAGIFNDFQLYIARIRDGVVYYLYDDRGLDVVGHSKESLQAIYNAHSSMLLNYDRERIDEQFKL